VSSERFLGHTQQLLWPFCPAAATVTVEQLRCLDYTAFTGFVHGTMVRVRAVASVGVCCPAFAPSFNWLQ
jgi:hypothetical protein